MEYELKSFIFHELPNNNFVVQSSNGIVEIFNDQMKGFIVKLDDLNGRDVISTEFIQKNFKEDTNDAIAFLLEYGILKSIQNYNFNIDKIVLCTNNNNLYDMASKYSELVPNEVFGDIMSVENFFDLKFDSTDFIFFFLNPYDREIIKSIKNKVDEECSYIQIAYIYNNNVYLDNIYKKSWKSPCHFCNINNIRTQLRAGIDDRVTYQHIIDDIFEIDSNFKLQSNFDHSQLVFLYDLILKTVNKLIRITDNEDMLNYGNEFLDVKKLNMTDFSITKETAVHWELCDCYG